VGSVECEIGNELVSRSLRTEIIQPLDELHHRLERGGNRGIGDVGEMHFAIHLVAVQLRVESASYLRGRTAAGDIRPASRLIGYAETLRSQPIRNPAHIRGTEPETGCKFFRADPVMVVRRSGVLLLREQLVECRLLAGGPLEHEGNAVDELSWVHGAAIELRHRPGTAIALENGGSGCIDRTGDSILLRKCCPRSQEEAKRSESQSHRNPPWTDYA